MYAASILLFPMFDLFRLATSPCTCYRPFFRGVLHSQNFYHSTLIDDAINHNVIGMHDHFTGAALAAWAIQFRVFAQRAHLGAEIGGEVLRAGRAIVADEVYDVV